MPIPQSSYDAAYYGLDPDLRRESGYTEYKRWYRTEAGKPSDAGEKFAEIARRIALNAASANDSFLEIGCALGFVVESLRAEGLDAHGIDWSAAAVAACDPALVSQGIIQVQDARTYIPTLTNKQYDYIYSINFFECLEDADIQPLIDAIKAKCQTQVHIIGSTSNPTFYNSKTEAEWRAYNWGPKARLFFPDFHALPEVV